MAPVSTSAPPTRAVAPRPRAPRLAGAVLIAVTGLALTTGSGNEILTPPTVSEGPPQLTPAVTAPPALVLVGARTYPVIGEHEYDPGTADPTFDYFGSRAGPRGQGYYSVDLSD